MRIRTNRNKRERSGDSGRVLKAMMVEEVELLLPTVWTVEQCRPVEMLSYWGRESGGRLKREEVAVYLRMIHVVVQEKPTQHFRAIVLQCKK